MVFGMSSCSSDPEPRYWGIGSYEYFSTPYIMNYDGTKFVAAPGSSFPVLDASFYGTRSLMEFYYSKAEEYVQSGPGVTVPISLVAYNYAIYNTFTPVEIEGSDFSDPIIGMYEENGKPIISTITNFLTFIPQIFLFMDNAEGDYTYASFSFALEIDEELTEDEKGNKVINTWLKHNANRATGEKINLSNDIGLRIAFDFESVASKYGWDETETYTIKVNYTSYEWDGNSAIDEENLVEKYITTTWTPNEPYVQED